MVKDWDIYIEEYSINNIHTLLNIDICTDFIYTIINYNIYTTKKQIQCLLKAFDFVNYYKKDNSIIDKQIIYQINVAKNWCKYYDVDVKLS